MIAITFHTDVRECVSMDGMRHRTRHREQHGEQSEAISMVRAEELSRFPCKEGSKEARAVKVRNGVAH